VRKFSPGENFAHFTTCSHWRKFYHATVLEDMATFTEFGEINSTKINVSVIQR
jgi:hypothetical protein